MLFIPKEVSEVLSHHAEKRYEQRPKRLPLNHQQPHDTQPKRIYLFWVSIILVVWSHDKDEVRP